MHPLDKLREEARNAQERSQWFDEWAQENPEAIRSFLDELGKDPVDTLEIDRITAELNKHVGYDEILTACRASEHLYVFDHSEGSIVGLLDNPTLVMPSPNIRSLKYFIGEHADSWLQIPNDGSAIKYVSVRDKGDVFIVPTLTEIESRTSFGLCFRIMEALGLEEILYEQEG